VKGCDMDFELSYLKIFTRKKDLRKKEKVVQMVACGEKFKRAND
jgi:hypothetical protein